MKVKITAFVTKIVDTDELAEIHPDLYLGKTPDQIATEEIQFVRENFTDWVFEEGETEIEVMGEAL